MERRKVVSFVVDKNLGDGLEVSIEVVDGEVTSYSESAKNAFNGYVPRNQWHRFSPKFIEQYVRSYTEAVEKLHGYKLELDYSSSPELANDVRYLRKMAVLAAEKLVCGDVRPESWSPDMFKMNVVAPDGTALLSLIQ